MASRQDLCQEWHSLRIVWTTSRGRRERQRRGRQCTWACRRPDQSWRFYVLHFRFHGVTVRATAHNTGLVGLTFSLALFLIYLPYIPYLLYLRYRFSFIESTGGETLEGTKGGRSWIKRSHGFCFEPPTGFYSCRYTYFLHSITKSRNAWTSVYFNDMGFPVL